MAYMLECLGESEEYDYAYFSNVTGDSLTQLYSRNPRVTAWCCSQNLFDEAFARRAFDACGYGFSLHQGVDAEGWRELLPLVRAQIDRGRPVIARGGGG